MDAKQRITKEQMKKTEQWWDGKYKYPENPSHFHNFVTHLAESYLDMLEEHERATDIRQYLQDKYTQLREENKRLRELLRKCDEDGIGYLELQNDVRAVLEEK